MVYTFNAHMHKQSNKRVLKIGTAEASKNYHKNMKCFNKVAVKHKWISQETC